MLFEDKLLYEFMHIVKKYINDDKYKILKTYIQHGNTTVYKHSLLVAYLCYKEGYNNSKINLESLVKAAMLHDYFLYDWHVKGGHKGLHGFNHPAISARNAKRDFNITKLEAEIIRHHMWPLTFFHFPRSKEAWILLKCDKRAAFFEMKHKKKQK